MSPSRRPTRALLVAALALAACTTPTANHAAPVHDRNLITADEISAITATTAYDVVKRLRPQFLQGRGATSINSTNPSTPIVYLDGMRLGDLSALSGIDAARIATIRYLSGPDAQQRFGTDHVGGAILVTTKM